CSCLFFFNDTATTEIYTLSLHDALPIWLWGRWASRRSRPCLGSSRPCATRRSEGTRLNSSHRCISYAVFCLKKKQLSPRCRAGEHPRQLPQDARHSHVRN